MDTAHKKSIKYSREIVVHEKGLSLLPCEGDDQVDVGVHPAEVALKELRVFLKEIHFGEDWVEGKSASVAEVKIRVMCSEGFSAILLGKPTSGQSLSASSVKWSINS